MAVTGPDGRPAEVLARDEPFTIEVDYVAHEPVPGLALSVYVQNLRDVRVVDESWVDRWPEGRGEAGEHRATVTIPPVLNVGDHTVGVWMGTGYEELVWADAVGAVPARRRQPGTGGAGHPPGRRVADRAAPATGVPERGPGEEAT